VFIGSGMDHTAIIDGLTDCLVDDKEWNGGWESVENPFPGRRDESRPPTEQRLVVRRRH